MKRLQPSQLTWACPSSAFSFRTTKEIKPLRKIIGQERAMEAIRMGASLQSQGYNIYASGLNGTGRLTTIQFILDEIGKGPDDLSDFCYVHNFAQPDMPVLIRFAPGEGKRFAALMEDAVSFALRRIPQLFEDEQFLAGRKQILDAFQQQEQALIAELDKKIRPSGFVVGMIETEEGQQQTEIFPIIDGQPATIDEFDSLIEQGKLTVEKAREIAEQYAKYREELADIGRRSVKKMVEFRKKLSTYDQSAVSVILKTLFDAIMEEFQRDRVRTYLLAVQRHLLDNLENLVKLMTARDAGASDAAVDEAFKSLTSIYRVNLILDHSVTKKAPIIVETSPTYTNLFGTIERTMDARGFVSSDFQQIKAGSILRADGGYLIMNILDVMAQPLVWQALKRIMLHGRLEIQNPDGQIAGPALKPEMIRVNVKIILLGDREIYNALWENEEDFHKMFKMHAEFWSDMPRSSESLRHYAQFFAHLAVDENLLHCDRSGAAALCEWAVAYAGSKEKITLQLSYVADLVREASYFARMAGAGVISRTHVRAAIDKRRWLSNQVDEAFREQIRNGMMLIDTAGSRVGQINGLTVYTSGIVSFGKPARITATVSAGNAGIINIEREVALSGPIHTKGVLILSGLIRSLFSRSQSMSFTASIAFEQSYGGVDGDSASVAEVIALLSAISNIPIRQDVAITGSINQKGDVQAVGGINEKITGFFEVCKDKKLTGSQGVVIPEQNIKDLMLRDEIVAAVKARQFNIWPVARVEQAVELMMGMPAGAPRPDGQFPPNSVYCKVQHNLSVLHEASTRGLQR
jgi:lon-related putative ATP-dependent protease